MHSLIEELCTNNNSPSDEIVREIKNSLVKPLQDLENLDLEILTLERRLQELKSKRNDAEKWIARYQHILSPIRKLPRDALGEIFQHCLPFHTNPILKRTECPLLLTQVCKLWRDVALSHPRLWSRIHITFTEAIPDAISSTSQNKELQKRLDGVKEWLSRAGTRPLSMSVCYFYIGGGPEYSPITTEFLRYLSQLSPRFQDLELTMPPEIYELLENMIDALQMTSLISIKISSSPSSTLTFRRPFALLKAPKLARASALGLGGHGSFWGILDTSYTSLLGKLTHISVQSWMTKNCTLLLLSRTTNLVHLEVTICDDDDEEEDISLSYQGLVSLPFLRTLFLFDAMVAETRGNIYERINAPALRWIIFSPADLNRSYETSPTIPIISLLETATGLEKLSINPPSMKYWDVGSAFRTVPSITHLFIGHEPTTANRSAQRLQFHHHSSPLLDLRSLLPNVEPPLLPNLQSLEINSPYTLSDDENILILLKYRMSPSANSGISALKHFAAAFYQPEGRDLDEEIRQHAELLGIGMIDLVLGYEKPPPERTPTQVLRADVGLKEVEVPTGLEANVDNYICFDSEIL